ncbi:hypothetical protein Pmani_030918 [Petrolisthes manimaculis]|uniref:Uncharacterized protein n=1 Tax=Petrolisthes manimaculis TaxID=1843537 RepID=A0AAE1NJ39_9EUCA|nr:hypothetical protein Pmani_036708 [Petrolisthes manimaculis]KAK4296598.1 hypothetical protein Pmani_030918 [Petrolisthes manimaculis]
MQLDHMTPEPARVLQRLIFYAVILKFDSHNQTIPAILIDPLRVMIEISIDSEMLSFPGIGFYLAYVDCETF